VQCLTEGLPWKALSYEYLIWATGRRIFPASLLVLFMPMHVGTFALLLQAILRRPTLLPAVRIRWHPSVAASARRHVNCPAAGGRLMTPSRFAHSNGS
jgi:hypothetical protein